MYLFLLSVHVSAAVLTVLCTVLTLLWALLRQDRLLASKVILVVFGVLTVVTGGGLVHVTGQSWGRLCLPASVLLLASWGAYGLLRWRLVSPKPA